MKNEEKNKSVQPKLVTAPPKDTYTLEELYDLKDKIVLIQEDRGFLSQMEKKKLDCISNMENILIRKQERREAAQRLHNLSWKPENKLNNS